MSTSVLVDLALEDLFLDFFGLPFFLVGLELRDLDFLDLVGLKENEGFTKYMLDYIITLESW